MSIYNFEKFHYKMIPQYVTVHTIVRIRYSIGLANRVYAHNDSEIMPDIAAWTTMADAWMERQPRK